MGQELEESMGRIEDLVFILEEVDGSLVKGTIQEGES